ncbi:MAG: ribosomal protein S18-alanine N-acetyltransferase [Clostridia bacterium]|nr:ribosomal protein S18-alanine N-acetyltransferase [Clostridia bacterium]
MNIRKCRYEDILRISELEKECFKGEGWSFGSIASAFENPAYRMLVAEEGGEVIGYGCTCTVCETCDLENVLVAEEYRMGGVGRAILNALLDDVKERGAEKVFLEVRVSNVAALRLYLSCGFVGVHARTRYYSDGEDCLVMQRIIEK